MSGTSLDGVDIAYCSFDYINQNWSFQVIKAETFPYSSAWKTRLSSVEKGTAQEFALTDIEYGKFLGTLTGEFIRKYDLCPDFIASHGHTIFHQPGKKFTCQIGKGSSIASETGYPVVCDFRSLDVALGGQGAPLVPIGDRLLFSEFDFCLNLGGFANISYENAGKRIAYDICPVNIVLNHLAETVGKSYDRSGEMAGIGTLSPSLLAALDHLPYYQQKPPKSLGKEWILANIYPLLESSSLRLNDQMNTFCEHIALQIAKATSDSRPCRILLTGGGTFNDFLLERIKIHTRHQIVIPDDNTVNFKEAMIFAFLGLLRWREEVNCLASVTGASKGSIGGAIYLNQ